MFQFQPVWKYIYNKIAHFINIKAQFEQNNEWIISEVKVC